MAAPIAPIALTALRWGSIAALAYLAARRTQAAPKEVWREQALDEAPEGIELTTDGSEAERNVHGAARLNRTIRFGSGPGVEIDISALGRIRIRRGV
ncbi:MAG: hypothetical protein AAGI50_07395 [Pseudomonadota bacterium]